MFKRLLLIILAALIIYPCICLSTETAAQAGTQTFVLPNETKITPVRFVNGSFETPVVTPMWELKHMDDVPGWGTIPVSSSNYSNPYAYYFQVARVSVPDGNQHIELNAAVPERVYQNVATTPGSRVCWSFEHRALGKFDERTPGNDVMNFYLRAAGTPTTPPTSAQLVQTANNDSAQWYNFKGIHTVPAGRTQTEVSFASVSSWTNEPDHGNSLDYVRFQTGSKLIAKQSISTSAADNSIALKGEIVTVTVTVTNWGEVDASHCVFTDVLSDGLDYVAGSARINGTAAGTLATFNAGNDVLRINFGTGATAGATAANGGLLYGSTTMGTSGSTGQGQTTTLTFQARVTANAGYLVKNQARVDYSDDGWESYTGTLYCYSSVLGQTPTSGNEATYVNRFTVVDRSLSGRVWYDANVNGMVDTAETRVSGLTVGLYANTDTTYTTPVNDVNGDALITTTSTTGTYSFSAILAGTYKVVTTTPSGQIVTIKTVSTDNDANASGTRAIISPIGMNTVLTATNTQHIISNMDIGFAVNRTVNGRVWYDTNVDGMIGTSETRASGLTVGIYQNADTTYSTPVNNIYGTPLTATTNASGVFSLSAIPAGTYKVVMTTPTGNVVTVKTLTTDNDATASGTRAIVSDINLSTATSVANLDFGFAPDRTVEGSVWLDADADGMIDSGEARVSGAVAVGLYDDDDTTYAQPVNNIYGNQLVALPDTNGLYRLSAIPVGTYKLVIKEIPSGTIVTVKTVSTDNDAVAEGTNAVISNVNLSTSTAAADQDFGFIAGRTAIGRVWYDEDADGMIDSGETRASGLTVGLYQNTDTTYASPVNDNFGNPLVTATNASGVYSFSAIPLGTYQIVITTPAGYLVAVKTISTDNDAVASGTRAIVSNVSLTTASSVTNLDFGFVTNRSINGRAWFDTDADGTIDTGESRASGLTVALYQNSDTAYTTPVNNIYGSPLVTSTNATGVYSFAAIPPGVYKAVMTTPTGCVVTVLANDNDAVGEGNRAVVSGINLTSATISADRDFGFINAYSITLSKTVKGKLADPKKDFTFTVALPGVTGSLQYTGASTITGVSAPAGGTVTNGGTVTLRHGQSITISSVPANTVYTITESNAAGYMQSVTGNNASGTLTGPVTVQFVNTKNPVTPTGILLDILPYVIMLVLAVFILVIILTIRRNKKHRHTSGIDNDSSYHHDERHGL